MVRECAKGKYHGLHRLNEREIREVIGHLLELKQEFEQIVFKNFPSQNVQLQIV